MTKFTDEKYEALKKAMMEVKPVEKPKKEPTKQERIKGMKAQIKHMQKSGYTLEMVAKFIREHGLTISAPTLKSYLSRGVSGGKSGNTSKPSTTKNDGAAVENPSEKPKEPKKPGKDETPLTAEQARAKLNEEIDITKIPRT